MPKRLTARQEVIATMIAKGFTRKQVADVLGIVERTVDYHMVNIYSLLEINSPIVLTHYMLHHEYIDNLYSK